MLQANHKQTALMKELTKVYSTLLQDKRVKSEQTKYENFTRQRNTALSKYRKLYQFFNDLNDGILRAQNFYSEMKDTVDSLEKNAEAFVNNRRSEGAQLLGQIERDKRDTAGNQADRERDRLRDLMERMSTEPSTSGTITGAARPASASRNSHNRETNFRGGYTSPASPHPQHVYNPSSSYASSQQSIKLPDGYVPPPPPPGPPPQSSYGNYTFSGHSHASGTNQDHQHHGASRRSNDHSQGQADPWASLNDWR